MSSPEKGMAYILNNSQFQFPGAQPCQQRIGSDVDLTNMKHLFRELGYKITCHKDLKSKVG